MVFGTKKNIDFLKFGNQKVFPGERKKIQIEVAALYDYTKLSIPIEVIRGEEEGPILFISFEKKKRNSNRSTCCQCLWIQQ
jgi:hypothetical protein